MRFYVEGDNGAMLECDSITINDGDTIRVTIDPDKWDLDQSYEAYEQVCKLFPNNKVIGLFSGMILVKENEEEPVQLEYEGLDEYWGPWGKCPKCGHSNIDYDGYCSYCGVKIRGSNKGE